MRPCLLSFIKRLTVSSQRDDIYFQLCFLINYFLLFVQYVIDRFKLKVES
jgi:hypothetical protein